MVNCMFEKLTRAVDWVLSRIFSNKFKCVCCGKDVFSDSEEYCTKCSMSITRTKDKRTCIKCHRPIYGEGDYCMICTDYTHEFDVAYSVYTYSGTISEMIRNMKYSNKMYLAPYFAKHLIDKYADMPTCDIVVSVPPSMDRARYRYHDHTKLLARAFSEGSGVEYIEGLLKRLKDTEPLEKKSPKQRREHLKGAFAISDRRAIKGKRVLLIDDVFTTGATADECASVIKKMGALEVYILTIAVTEYKVKTI